MFLLLIRHGENDYLKKHKLPGRLPGVHLNAEGRAQAEALRDALKDAPIAAIYSSPLERARETAAPLARAKRMKVKVEPGLLETDIGAWAGRSHLLLGKTRDWQLVQNSPSRFRFPDGESFLETQVRMAAAIERMQARHPRGLVVCFSHGDPIKLAIAHLIGLPLDCFQRLGMDTGAASLLAVSDSGARLLWHNQRPPFRLPEGRG